MSRARIITVTRLCALVLLALPLAAQTVAPERLFRDAVAAQERGEDAVAARKYRELLRTHPGAVMVRVNLGVTLAHMGRWDEAIEQYRRVLASDPKNREVRMNLALAYYEKTDCKKVVAELEPVHRSAPNEIQPAMLLGDCYGQLSRYADAVSVLSPLESTHAGNAEFVWLFGKALIHAGRAPEGVERIEKAAAAAGNAETYLMASQTRLELNQYDQAKADADNAQRLNATQPGLPTLNGMILERTGDYTGAETALRQALKADEKDFNAHFYLGAILYFRRDTGQARLHLERALRLQPTSLPARYELALVARAEGHNDEALRTLQGIVRDDPTWLQPHIELAALYYKLNRPEDGAQEQQTVDHLLATQSEHRPLTLP